MLEVQTQGFYLKDAAQSTLQLVDCMNLQYIVPVLARAEMGLRDEIRSDMEPWRNF